MRSTAGGDSHSKPVIFNARYRGLGPNANLAENRGGTFEHFVTERSCLYSSNRAGQPIRANLHYVSWPLEEAEAEIERNDLATSIGLTLPKSDPVLHYSRRLAVYVWPRELVRPALVGQARHSRRLAFRIKPDTRRPPADPIPDRPLAPHL